MSGAIAKALPTCIGRTLGQVGFAQGRKLLLSFTNLHWFKAADFHSQRGIWRESEAQIKPGPEFLAGVSGASGRAKRFRFRYNSTTPFCHDAPVAQLDRVHGYEP